MCFVLDVNAFSCVFDSASEKHDDFNPLRKWLDNNPKTCLVYGGKKYKDEIGRMNKYFPILIEYKKLRKINEICDKKINKVEKDLIKLIDNKDFDDAHHVAIFCVSGCLIFASLDKRADQYIKMNELYPSGQSRPRIYRSKDHRHLLCDDNIVKLKNVIT